SPPGDRSARPAMAAGRTVTDVEASSLHSDTNGSPRRRRAVLAGFGAGVLCILSGPMQAQEGGLDALEEDRVLTELAARGLTDLLKHAFERQGVPEYQRVSLMA